MPLLGALLALSACGTLGSLAGTSGPAEGAPGFVRGFLGGVVAEEPRAALAGREVLSAGGSATDAAVAMGFALSVTLPSRAALGGGGACVVWQRARPAEALGFAFPAPAGGPPEAAGDRPAAVPMLARGLFALHARGGGRLAFERLVAPSEAMARFGIATSRSLARDLAPVAPLLARDPQAAQVFATQGRPLAEGDQLTQPELANTLGLIRTQGPGDLHQGALARRVAEASTTAGGAIGLAELRAAVPRVETLAGVRIGNHLHFAAPDAGARAAVSALQAGQPQAADQGGTVGAGTGFVAVDREGNAVACALSMNNLFGTGRIAPGTGVLLAASPTGRVVPPPLPALIVANDRVRAFRFAGSASGGAGAAAALALVVRAAEQEGVALEAAIARGREGLSQGEGRVSAIHCPGFLPGRTETCTWRADPRGAGLAVGAD